MSTNTPDQPYKKQPKKLKTKQKMLVSCVFDLFDGTGV